MNGKAHRLAGGIAGPAAGMWLAVRAERAVSGPEIGGWLVGGIAGGKLPDLLEPSTYPGHRKFAHSGTLLAGDLMLLQSQTLETWILWLKRKATGYRRQAQLNPESAICRTIVAGLLEFLAGAIPAMLGGYASHLICDATTPFGIPLC